MYTRHPLPLGGTNHIEIIEHIAADRLLLLNFAQSQ